MKRYLILLLSIFIVGTLQAEEKKITKTFRSSDVAKLKLDNKFGDIKVENWTKQELEINVVVKALSNKPSVGKKILEKVKVKFKHKRDSIFVKTDFGSFFSLKKFTNSFFSGCEFSVNYEVKMPKDIDIDLVLKNGNIVLFERTGNVKINHKDGSISVEKLEGEGIFELDDSSLYLDKAGDLLINSRNSRLVVNDSKTVKVNSYNSEYELKNLQNLEGEFSRDDFKIGGLQQFFGKAKASTFTIGNLERNAVVDFNRGAFTLEGLNPEFEELKLTAKNTNLAILLSSTAANILVSHHISTKMDLGEDIELNMRFGETQKDFISSGTIGNPKGDNKILIDIKGGKLHLR